MTRTDGGGFVVVLRQMSISDAGRRAAGVQRLFRMQPRRRRHAGRRRRRQAAVKCTGIIVVSSQHSVFKLVFCVERDVGRLDVHESDGRRAAPVADVIAFLAKDLDTLNTTKPGEMFLYSFFSDVLWKVAHPEVPCFTHHDSGCWLTRDLDSNSYLALAGMPAHHRTPHSRLLTELCSILRLD